VSEAATLPFPKFDRPPVYETVLGVQFDPLKGFSIPHYGLYWGKIQRDYPRYEVHPPLSSAVEQFGSEAIKESKAGIELLTQPEARTWFLNEGETILLQVQKDRFLQNWRKMDDGDVYPHYDELKPKFFYEWQRFCQFLDENRIETPNINQCEVTYVNHIDIEQGPRSYGRLSRIISCWSGTYSGQFLSDPESVNFSARYLLPDKRGRLHIAMQPAIRRKDAKEILRLSLTARGKPHSSNAADIQDWLNVGHEWIVRAFTDITTPEMHQYWERTQ